MRSPAVPASVSMIRAAASLLSSNRRMRAGLRSSDGSPPGSWAKWPRTLSRSRNSSISRFRRTRERTRAKSAISYAGFRRKSSAPASSPVSRSAASESAVIMTTGICEVAGSAFRRRHTSNPSISGIITSSSTRSGSCAAQTASAAAPPPAVKTSKYSLASLAPSSLTLMSTSSTTSMRADIEAALAQEAFDHFEEVSDGNRLGDIRLATALADLFLVALHGKRRDRDDRDGAQFVVLLDPFGDLQPRNLRQLNIHQDQIGAVLARQLERRHTVLGLQCI